MADELPPDIADAVRDKLNSFSGSNLPDGPVEITTNRVELTLS